MISINNTPSSEGKLTADTTQINITESAPFTAPSDGFFNFTFRISKTLPAGSYGFVQLSSSVLGALKYIQHGNVSGGYYSGCLAMQKGETLSIYAFASIDNSSVWGFFYSLS